MRRPGPAISGDAAELLVGINVAGDSLARQQRREIAIGAGDAVISDPGGGRVHRAAPRTVPAFEPHPAKYHRYDHKSRTADEPGHDAPISGA